MARMTPPEKWRQTLWARDEYFSQPIIRQFNSQISWQENNSFDALLPRFGMLKEVVPEVFEDGRFEWAFVPESYDFPQEVMLQNFVFETLANLSTARHPSLVEPRYFPEICARLTSHWSVNAETPYAQSSGGDCFVVVPFGWIELVSCFLSAFGSDNASISELLHSNRSAKPAKSVVDEARRTALAFSVGRWNLPLCYQLAALRHAKNNLGLSHIVTAPASRPALRTELETACLRFLVAHEVGHIIAAESVNNSPEGDEISADTIALISSFVHLRNEPDQFKNLQPNPDVFIHCFGAETFFYVYRLWLNCSAAASQAEGRSIDSTDGETMYSARRTGYEESRAWLEKVTGQEPSTQTFSRYQAEMEDFLERFGKEFDRYISESIEAIDDAVGSMLDNQVDPWNEASYLGIVQEQLKELEGAKLTVANDAGAIHSIILGNV